ncbi:MAG: hypothetical protein IAF38_13050 [Bacteroidia bacterium]|nr:hypothetical protein [Bacteroidia bacterium]
MKKLLVFFSVGLFVFPCLESCKKFMNPDEEIPSYIYVPACTFSADTINQGTRIQKISDVWVFKGNDFLGAFPIGAKIPVLAEGNTEIKMRAGIKNYGIGDLRAIYPITQFYDVNVDLKRGEVVNMTPDFSYFSGITFIKLESFSSPGTFLTQSLSSDTMLVSYTGPEAMPGQGACAYVHLDSTYQVFEALSGFPHPYVQGAITYLEINYKSNVDIAIAVSNGINDVRTVCRLKASATWNKMYAPLTEALNAPSTLSNFFFVIHAVAANNNADIYFDNIKIIKQ